MSSLRGFWGRVCFCGSDEQAGRVAEVGGHERRRREEEEEGGGGGGGRREEEEEGCEGCEGCEACEGNLNTIDIAAVCGSTNQPNLC